MSADQPKEISIDSFPNDGVSRVVYRYGGLLKNNNDLMNPLVEVLLIEIRMSDQWLYLDRCSTGLVPVVEIDAVQTGSIWVGDTLSQKTYKFNRKLVKRKFSFNLSEIKPQNIKLTDKIPNTSEYYMSLKNYYLPNSNNADTSVYKYPLTQYSKGSYQKVNHCLMVSNDNIQVIASSIHILHACFSNTKELRKLLLRTSPKKIVDRYLDIYFSEEINGDSKYTIKLKETCKEKFKPISIVLLAYLGLNKHVQSVVEKIQSSLENTDYHEYKSGKNIRYPIVSPPHPTKLDMEAEGIWLDEEHTRFLITRFINIDPIADHKIDVLPLNQSETSTTSGDKTPIPSEKSKEKNERINTQQPPSRRSGEYRRQSDIEYGDASNILNFLSPEEVTSNKRETDKYQYQTSDPTEEVQTSSDDCYGNKKNNIKKAESDETQKNRDNSLDLKNIMEALSELIQDRSCPLVSIFSINSSGKEVTGYKLLQIKNLVKLKNTTSFIYKSKGRNLLFLRLTFKNNNGFCYFIEIKPNNSRDFFCAYLFLTNQSLSETQVKEICTQMSLSKGSKKWGKQCDFISSMTAITHNADTSEKWKNKFQALFEPFSNKAYNI